MEHINKVGDAVKTGTDAVLQAGKDVIQSTQDQIQSGKQLFKVITNKTDDEVRSCRDGIGVHGLRFFRGICSGLQFPMVFGAVFGAVVRF